MGPMHAFIGGDPGKYGAIVMLAKDELLVYDWERLANDPWRMVQELDRHLHRAGCGATVRCGAVESCFRPNSLVDNGGRMEFFVHMLTGGVKPLRVAPITWRKHIYGGVPKKGTDLKGLALDTANERIGHRKFDLKKHHNRAEAYLIASWLKDNYREKL